MDWWVDACIEVVPLERGAAALVADFADQFGLRNHDTIQLGTAVRGRSDAFLAWHGDLHRGAGRRRETP
jgi:hypothetical protein